MGKLETIQNGSQGKVIYKIEIDYNNSIEESNEDKASDDVYALVFILTFIEK